MKSLFVFLCLFLSFFFLRGSMVLAIYDPTSCLNNRFGIHVVSEADFENAANLVNSNNGKWGYVTFVIRQDEKNLDYWQEVFRKLNRLRLIPIVRLATFPQDDYWQKPTMDEAKDWADFLDQLPWPIENRYVILFNEPNHAKEWGQQINPEEYASVLTEYSRKIKEKSDQFFILPAGLDASANNSPGLTMDEVTFIKQMLKAYPDVFNYIDGWTSHSYPQPGFKGNPNDQGRGTVRTFLWEEELLKSLGVDKKMPVFITETGWNQQGIDSNTLSYYYKTAFETVWNDPQIITVTPFLLNYQAEPFANFSWQVLGTSTFYPHYYQVQNLTKLTGVPKQNHSVLIANQLPESLIVNSDYQFSLKIKNNGQSIIDFNDRFVFKVETNPKIRLETSPLPVIEPGQSKEIKIKLTSPEKPQAVSVKYWLAVNDTIISGTKQQTLNFYPLLSLKGFMAWLKLLE